MNNRQLVVCGLFVLIGVAGLLAPFLRYVIVGWKAKRRDVMNGLGPRARLAYFRMFGRSEPTPTLEQASARFETLYTSLYGRRYFLVPGLLLFLVAVLSVSLAVLTVLHTREFLDNPLFNLPDSAVAAVAGAYLWVANDFISRARRLDFASTDILWGALRLIISVPMGNALATIAAPSIAPFIAFAAGAFPLSTLLSMLRKLGNKALGQEGASDEASEDDIIKLQGINNSIVERLSNEDITTVTQIAYCDPVRLTMRSNLTFNFVTDCMNQALAWMYLEDHLATLRPLGMRGAGEISILINQLDYPESGDTDRIAERARAIAAFPKLAAAINQKPETLQLVFRQIATDPFTCFLQEVWTHSDEAPTHAASQSQCSVSPSVSDSANSN